MFQQIIVLAKLPILGLKLAAALLFGRQRLADGYLSTLFGIELRRP